MQAGNDEPGIRRNLELCVLLADEGPPAGENLVSREGTLQGWGTRAGSVWFGGAHLGSTRTGGGWQDEERRGEHKGKMSGRLVPWYHFVPKRLATLLWFTQSLQSSGQNMSMSTAVFFSFPFFFFFYHKSHHSCSWQFEKLLWPFSPLFLVGKITWKCYSSNSLNSGQMPDFFFFHFVTAPSSPSSCGQELLLLPKATVLTGSLKVKTQRKKQCMTQKQSTCAVILGSGVAARTDNAEIKDPLVYAVCQREHLRHQGDK